METFKKPREIYSEGEITSDEENKNIIETKNLPSNSKSNNVWSDILCSQNLVNLTVNSVINGIQKNANLGIESYFTLPNTSNVLIKDKNKQCKPLFKFNNKKSENVNESIESNLYVNTTSYKRSRKNSGRIPQHIVQQFSEQTLAQRRKHIVYKLNGPKPKAGYERFYKKLNITFDMDINLYVVIISNYLEETNIELLTKIVNKIGIEKMSEVLCESDAIQTMGGLYTMNGERKRTFGGCFFIMLKTDPTISNQVKDEIFERKPNVNGHHKQSMRKIILRQSQPDVKGTEHNPDCNVKLTDDTILCDKSPNLSQVSTPNLEPPATVPTTLNGDTLNQSGSGNRVIYLPHKRGSRQTPLLPVEIRKDNKFFYTKGHKNYRSYRNGNQQNRCKRMAGSKESIQSAVANGVQEINDTQNLPSTMAGVSSNVLPNNNLIWNKSSNSRRKFNKHKPNNYRNYSHPSTSGDYEDSNIDLIINRDVIDMD